MANMGYGLNREVYARKPKKIYSRIKQLYGEKLEKHRDAKYKTVSSVKPLSEDDRQAIRSSIKASIAQENRKRVVILLASLALTVVVLGLIIWGVRLVFGF